MTIRTERHGDTFVVSVGGRLDGVTAADYEKTIRELIDNGTTRIVADFDELSYISSAGLREIIVTAKLLQEKSGQFGLANVHGNVLSVFNMCGMEGVLKIHPSVADALA
jgi:anti-anti-sigma factor